MLLSLYCYTDTVYSKVRSEIIACQNFSLLRVFVVGHYSGRKFDWHTYNIYI